MPRHDDDRRRYPAPPELLLQIEAGEAWLRRLRRAQGGPGLADGTLAYRRSVWEGHPFPDVELRASFGRAGLGQAAAVEDPDSAVREFDDDRISLADVEEDEPEEA